MGKGKILGVILVSVIAISIALGLASQASEASKYEGLTDQEIYVVKVKEDSCAFNEMRIWSETQAERYRESCKQQVQELIQKFRTD